MLAHSLLGYGRGICACKTVTVTPPVMLYLQAYSNLLTLLIPAARGKGNKLTSMKSEFKKIYFALTCIFISLLILIYLKDAKRGCLNETCKSDLNLFYCGFQ